MPVLAMGRPAAGATPDLDTLLAQLGLGAPAGAAPYDASGDAGGADVISQLGLASPPSAGQGAAGAPPPAGPRSPADMAAMIPPPPQLPAKRGVLGDILDDAFLGGSIKANRSAEYARQLAAYDVALKRVGMIRNYEAVGALPQGQQPLAILAPDKFVEGVAKPVTTAEGSTTTYFGDPSSRFTAPKFITDNGRVGEVQDGKYSELGNTGPALTASADGNVLDSRGVLGTGAVNSVPVFKSFPAADTHGFVRPGAAAGGASPGANAAAAAPAAPDQAYLAALHRIESGGNNAARNGSSIGIDQFHPDTFAAMGGKNINDPAEQDAAALKYRDSNAAELQGAGLPVTPGTLFLAHQQGAAGAKALLKANPTDSAVAVLQDSGLYKNSAKARRAITGNGGRADMTVGEFTGMWNRRFGKALQRAGGDPNAAAAAPSETGGAGGDTSGLTPGRMVIQNPDGSETDPVGHRSAGPNMITPNDAIAMGKSVREDPSYRAAQESGAAFKSMLQLSGQANGGMRAYALRDTFARTVNPLGAVRVGTIDALKESQGIPASIQAYFMNLKGDGDVPPEIVKQIITAAAPFAQANWDHANALNQHYAGIAKSHGLDPALATAPLDERPAVPGPPAAAGSIPRPALEAEMRRRGLLK